MDRNQTIGKDGLMPWYSSEELQHFKQTTWNQTIVMGRVTYENLPKQLRNREIIVLSKNHDYIVQAKHVTTRHALLDIISEWEHSEKRLFICGGAKIYEACLPYADELLISLLPKIYEGDTTFPYIDKELFSVVEEKEYTDFMFYKLHRK